jgi:hypothetical protein
MEELHMIKKHQKLIALSVVFAFLCLLQVSTMPLRAEQSPGQSETTMKSAEQGPNFVEEEGAPYAAKKKSILPVVLIGLGVVAVAAVLILVVFKTKYNPVGTWTGPMASQTQNWTGKFVFSGDKKSGTVLYSDPWVTNKSGTYTVDAKNISMTVNNSGQIIAWTGTFTSKDAMSGTWVNNNYTYIHGTWQVTRSATAALPPTPQSLAGGKGTIADK